MTVSIDSRVYFFEYEKEEGRIRHVIHKNRTYRTTLRNRQQEQLEVLLEQFGAGLGGAATETKLLAPMPGKILGLSVKEGEKIKLGQVALVLEAMKMENEISSNVEGKVKQIPFKVGDSVTAGDVLLEIEPPE
jgi:biotin carboxyl carrier protein